MHVSGQYVIVSFIHFVYMFFRDRFGLYEVNYDSPERTRTPRKSAYVYKEIVRTRTLDYQYEPDMSVPLSIDEGH